MIRLCPYCNRVLLKSVAPTCGWCGTELPEELRMSKAEIQRIAEEEQRKAAREKALEDIARETRREFEQGLRDAL